MKREIKREKKRKQKLNDEAFVSTVKGLFPKARKINCNIKKIEGKDNI